MRKARLFLFIILLNIQLLEGLEKTIIGYWLTSESVVEVKSCGDQICAEIIHLLVEEGIDPKSVLDENNVNANLRSRLLIGINLLEGFKNKIDSDGSIRGGKIYNPRDGRFYKSKLKLLNNGNLKVEGCLLFFCDGEEWRPLTVTFNEDGSHSAEIKNRLQ